MLLVPSLVRRQLLRAVNGHLASGLLLAIVKEKPADPLQFMIDALTRSTK
jgi:hypothetical protein